MNFKESKSIYLQIADRIEDEILQGRYPSGERIPSVREYAAQVEVNVNTVVRSYEYLQQQGIVYNKRGLGYFVADESKDLILRVRRETFMKEFVPEFFRQMRLLHVSVEDVIRKYSE